MILMEFNLDYELASTDASNLYLFTGNSYIKKNGALVMGRGAARQVRDMYPGIDKQIGDAMAQRHLGFYGLVGFYGPNENIGVFQVKYSYEKRAQFEIITRSVEALEKYAREFDRAIHMNYPGIGNGGLMQTDVAPLLTSLPDNVFLYRSS